jgi:hypothetical protein
MGREAAAVHLRRTVGLFLQPGRLAPSIPRPEAAARDVRCDGHTSSAALFSLSSRFRAHPVPGCRAPLPFAGRPVRDVRGVPVAMPSFRHAGPRRPSRSSASSRRGRRWPAVSCVLRRSGGAATCHPRTEPGGRGPSVRAVKVWHSCHPFGSGRFACRLRAFAPSPAAPAPASGRRRGRGPGAREQVGQPCPNLFGPRAAGAAFEDGAGAAISGRQVS